MLFRVPCNQKLNLYLNVLTVILLLFKILLIKEELRNTFVPIYNGRTETEVKAPFVEFGEDYGVDLMHFSQRIIPMYENSKYIVGYKFPTFKVKLALSSNFIKVICKKFTKFKIISIVMQWPNAAVFMIYLKLSSDIF